MRIHSFTSGFSMNILVKVSNSTHKIKLTPSLFTVWLLQPEHWTIPGQQKKPIAPFLVNANLYSGCIMLLSVQVLGSWSRLHWRWEREQKAKQATEHDTKLHAIALKSRSRRNIGCRAFL